MAEVTTAPLPRQDPSLNPNALHDFHKAQSGPKHVPAVVLMESTAVESPSTAKDPGHPYAVTKHISFEYFEQRKSNASFGYEHYVSLPPAYEKDNDDTKQWPLILFLHGAGESQRANSDSYASLRHGIPKVILCYDRLGDGMNPPSIDIPPPPWRRNTKQTKETKQDDQSSEPVSPEVCTFVAENFITLTPSLNLEWGYGWNPSILTALLDEVVQRYSIDVDRIHVTGFSMGGYGTWDLAIDSSSRFASLVPICGGGDPLRARLIKHVPQWQVHHCQRGPGSRG